MPTHNNRPTPPALALDAPPAYRFAYVFDSRSRRALIIDRRTGREYDGTDGGRRALVDHAGRGQEAKAWRLFARWCIAQTGPADADLEDARRRLAHVAERQCALDDAPDDALDGDPDERADVADAAALAATVGLPRGEAPAAAFLTAYAATHPDARRAALDAAHMSERWAEFAALADGRDPHAAASAMRQRHIDHLLDRLLDAPS